MTINDEEEFELGLRRHTDDKLTYKLIIANAINECRRTEGSIIKYPNNVVGLMNVISFDIKGYKLKTKIEQILDKNFKEKEKIWNEKKSNTERPIFEKRSFQAKFKLQLDRAFWESIFRDILQILADEGLLMEIEKYISVRSNE